MNNNYQSRPGMKKFPWLPVLLLLVMVLSGQIILKAQSRTQEEEDLLRFYDMFTEAYYKVSRTYVDEVEPDILFNGALRGMLDTLDDHSQYLNPDALQELQKDTGGEFSGIGIHISIRNRLLTVVAPIPGSPAAQLGLQPWDRIIEIEGESTEGITIMEAVKKLTGPEGTKVNITVYRAGEPEPLKFDITRASIKIDSVYHKYMEEDAIGYVRLTRFSENTTTDLKKALLEFKEKGAEGVVLDLRFNSGGLLSSAVEISDLFVPKGEVIVSTKGRIASQNKDYLAEQDPIIDIPLIVLINQASASASEIVAGAIKDHKLGVLMGPSGQRTFGKGSVQSIEPLENILKYDEDGNPQASAIRLTTAKYYTPSGVSIHKVGIAPDVEVDLPEDFEGKLLMHGMLGSPNQAIPDEKKISLKDVKVFQEDNGLDVKDNDKEDKKESEIKDSDPLMQMPDEDEEVLPADKENGDDETTIDNDEDFVDLHLNEAIKLLKSILIISDRYLISNAE